MVSMIDTLEFCACKYHPHGSVESSCIAPSFPLLLIAHALPTVLGPFLSLNCARPQI